MSGDRAQGLVCAVKSWTSVGSMYLSQVAGVRVRATNARAALDVLHELKGRARTPRQSERAFEYVSKQHVIGCVRLKKSA